MTENQITPKDAGSQPVEKNQGNNGKKSNDPSKDSATMVEESQSDIPKEHEDNGHQHDSKTPVGEKNRRDENAGPDETSNKGL